MSILLALMGCATPSDSTPTDTAVIPTYYKDVKPILDDKCMRCHSDGGLAPSFGGPETIQGMAGQLASRVDAGEMPPPAPDPSCRSYAGSDALVVSDTERATLDAWAAGGAPLGDEADDSSTPSDPLADRVWDMPLLAGEAYAPNFDTTGNDYRCFLVETTNEDTAWIQAFGAIIDNRSIVHHVVIYTLEDGVEVSDDPSGFSCSGLGEQGWDFFAGWAPGGGPVTFADDQAMQVEAHQQFVLQMHYFGDATDAGAIDQSGLGFDLRDDIPTHQVFVYPLGNYTFTIPADDEDYSRSFSGRWPSDYPTLSVVGVFPHMHLLGSQFYFEGGPDKDDETCMVSSPRWDFHNQVSVVFDEPVDIEPGGRLDGECHWDNSATSPYQYNDPPVDVSFGENSNDEMCFAFIYGYI